MENIKFEITEEDIKGYLKAHKDDEAIKYKEAMFVKYLKENGIITRESLEILMKKYNSISVPIVGTFAHYDKHNNFLQNPLDSFSLYLKYIKNLDISGICHILIPTLGYYGIGKNEYKLLKPLNLGMNALSYNLTKKRPDINTMKFELRRACEDYELAGKISLDPSYSTKCNVNIHMGREHCRKELLEYSFIYGEEPVDEIRKYIRRKVKERV